VDIKIFEKGITMKIVKTIIAFVAFATFASSAYGQELYVGSDGSVKMQDQIIEYTATGVHVTPQAWKYPEAVAKAHALPNIPITVTWSDEVYEKSDFWHYSKIHHGYKAVFYYREEGGTSFITTRPSKEIVKSTYVDFFLLASLVGIILMSIPLLFFNNKYVAFVSVSLTFAVTVGAIILGAEAATFAAALIYVIALFVAIIIFAGLLVAGRVGKLFYTLYLLLVTIAVMLHVTGFA